MVDSRSKNGAKTHRALDNTGNRTRNLAKVYGISGKPKIKEWKNK